MNGIVGSQGSHIDNSGKCFQIACHKDISNSYCFQESKLIGFSKHFFSVGDISFYILFSLICTVVTLLL